MTTVGVASWVVHVWFARDDSLSTQSCRQELICHLWLMTVRLALLAHHSLQASRSAAYTIISTVLTPSCIDTMQARIYRKTITTNVHVQLI